MKVLFVFSPHQRYSLMSKIQIEIVLDLLHKSHEVIFLACDSDNKCCYISQKHKESTCLKCVSRQHRMRDFILDNAPDPSKITFLLYDRSLFDEQAISSFKDLEELKNLDWKGVNIGWGIVSSLISHHRDHKLDLSKYQDEIGLEVNTSKFILDNIFKYVSLYTPDSIYFFNGRFSYQYPIFSYCIEKQMPFCIYEFTPVSSRFRLINNNTPHNIEYCLSEINKVWDENLDIEDKKEKGKSFFEKTRQGGAFMDHGYIDSQKKNLLPESVTSDREIISIFNSSIDEFAAVKGWEKKIPYFDSEYEALFSICSYFEKDLTKLFVLRVHPNLKFLTNTQIKEIEQLKRFSNLVIIPPESKVDTYAIIDISSKVITLGSTIGIEATYWGKPSILLGHSFYESLDVAYFPDNFDDLVSIIDTKDLLPKSQDNTIKYGYWWVSLGADFEYAKAFTPDTQAQNRVLKFRILLNQFRELEFSYIFSRIFTKRFYRKLGDKNFRKHLKVRFLGRG